MLSPLRTRVSSSLARGARALGSIPQRSVQSVPEEARQLHQLRSILGDRHPATISKMTQLAEAHSKAGQTEEALMLNSEAALYKRQLYAPTAI